MHFDTYAAVKVLTAAGADESLASAVVAVAQDASADVGRVLATRADVADLRTAVGADVADLRTAVGADVADLRTAVGADVADLRTAVGADVADLRTAVDKSRIERARDLAALEARLAWRLITAGIAIAGIAVAAGVALTVAVLRFVL